MNDILLRNITIINENSDLIVDPYQLARLNDLAAYPIWIKNQLLTLSIIILIINILFIIGHEKINSIVVNGLPVKPGFVYDLVFGVNIAFSFMILYVVFRS